MKISRIMEILGARSLTEHDDLDIEVNAACGSDMMSDVLAATQSKDILLTGLVNPQVVKTADMLDVKCIVFVRDKQPDETVIDLARQRGIILLSTPEKMFTACGKLYVAGLSGDGE
jgi:hypothetical protein